MQDNIRLRFNKEGNTLKVDIGGHLNEETCEKLAQELDNYYKGNYCNTVMAFDDINYIGSAGFKVLIKTHRNLESRGCKMTIRAVPIRIMAIIKALGFDKVFIFE